MSRTVVVVNPKSQGGAVGKRWPFLADLIRRRLSFDEAMTRGPGDATRLAREALTSGADRVVAVGGDGTINEVVNGFFDGDRPIADAAALGILPYGTGGDFRKSLGLPTDFESAIEVLARDRRRQIDLGRLEYTLRTGGRASRMFANIASFGVSGVVDRLVNKSQKRLGGKLTFLVASARASLQYDNQRVRLRFDGKSEGATDLTINTVAVANGRYFGGGMLIAPRAELDDGAFDVVALGDFGVLEMIKESRRLYAGTHLGIDKVSHRRARRVDAEPAGPGQVVELDVDGETPGILPATFTVVPRALSVVAPA
jgi:YegS/Rv2252/BmrU family lipid kinase